jgi:hypothetical protein
MSHNTYFLLWFSVVSLFGSDVHHYVVLWECNWHDSHPSLPTVAWQKKKAEKRVIQIRDYSISDTT